jgi:hypothetical protein
VTTDEKIKRAEAVGEDARDALESAPKKPKPQRRR